ncbi:MAG: proprotein convertase P-domain-containing protein [Lewinellaceae bacterium]|nr:proprotein convertase P-domain-containing protein [Lewinellaceae bacterium]
MSKLIQRAGGALVLILSAITLAYTQPCGCTNCPQFMPDNFTGDFLINVMNASNPTLGQNGQGVCGVVLNFDHEYIGDLKITLTSPAGQTVTLIGPVGLFGMTDFTSWNITFVPCGDMAAPDPGFSSTWNNNQPWGMFGNYNGSYYPNTGCLENFNTGSVNGTWTLTVMDLQANDVGNFTDYQIIFCDPSGINCFSCAANAGNLLQADVTACEGAPSLALNLPPTYTAQQPAPPAAEYGYTYIISGPGGVIQEYQDSPNLSSYPPGGYSVCGLSYLLTQQGDIPAPNGSLTVNQLTTQLNSTMPPFCGDVTLNCVNVTIFAAPPDEEEFATECAPNCYFFHGQAYCQTGTYVANLTSPQGCPYTATLYLEVIQPVIKNVIETVCANECASTPGFPDACSAGQYQEVFTAANGCDSIVTLNLLVNNVLAVIGNPPGIPCDMTPVQLSGAGSTTGGGVTYLWTASNGGNISGNPNAINTFINAAGDYQLRVCRSTGAVTCCDSISVNVIGNMTQPPAPGPITGNTMPCVDSTLSFSVPPLSGNFTYTWTVPPGVQIISGQGSTNLSVTWDSLISGNVCVTSTNSCGTSNPTCLMINPLQAPGLAQISGDTLVCTGTALPYQTLPVVGADGYNWTISGPGTLLAGQGTDSIQIQWNSAGMGQVCVQPYNVCGSPSAACLPVVIQTAPTISAVSGPSFACNGGSGVYSTTPTTGVSYNWQVSGGSIVSGAGTDAVTVQWNLTDTLGEICLNLSNNCGVSDTACATVMLLSPPPTPAINGTDTLCMGGTATYSINNIPGSTGYGWTVSGNGALLSGQNTTSISVQWNTPGAGIVTAAAQSNCGLGMADTLVVQVLSFPTANAGPDQSLCGLSTVLSASGTPAGSGQWTLLNGPGTAQFSAANMANSSVTVSANGAYNLLWTVNNGFCSDADTVQVNFNAPPQTGTVSFSCDPANQFYTVSFPVTGNGPFSIPGGTVTAGVFISSPIPTDGPYSFSITDINGCTATNVSGAHSCLCTTAPGTMSNVPLSACADGSVSATYNNDGILDGNDVLGFVLHSNAGNSLGTVYGANITGTFGFQAGMIYGVTYYISAVIGNNANGLPNFMDPCLAVSAGQPVVFYDYPIVMAGVDASVCGLQILLAAQPNQGNWTQISGPGSLSFSNPNAGNATATANDIGNYQAVWSASSNGCVAKDTLELRFFSFPQLIDIARQCDSTNEFYTVTLTINGGLPPYSVNGQMLTGNTFVSQPIANGAPYTFIASDANGCTMPDVVGAFACDCATDAGTMSPLGLEACIGSTVSAVSNNDQTTDGNDVLGYILHSNASASPGTIFAMNTNGVFGFSAGMLAGQTYYISQVVGNNLNGFPDSADPCYSVAEGQPVIFYALPVPNAGVDQSVCADSTLLQAAPGPFAGQWELISGPAALNFDQPQSATSAVTAAVTGTYQVRWVETNAICTAADTLEVQFNSVPLIDSLSIQCNGTATAYEISVQFSNGTAPYQVNGLIGSINGAQLTSAPIPSGDQYSFTISDVNGCVSLPQSGTNVCNCISQAGTMDNTPGIFCKNDPASATWNNDGTLDDDDVLLYVLHDQAGTALGNVFATATQPVFAFAPPLQTGITYYISAVVGNASGSFIDPADPCLSVSNGVPVQWSDYPVADAGPDQELDCNHLSFELGANSSAGPGITYSWFRNNMLLPGDMDAQLPTTEPGLFTLVVTNAAGCSASDAVQVASNVSTPIANAIAAQNVRCFGESNGSLIIEGISGGTTPVLFAINGGPFQSQPNFSNLAAGAYVVTLQDAIGCEWTSDTIFVIQPPVLVANLGPDVKIELGEAADIVLNASVSAAALDTIIWKPLLDSLAVGQPFQRFTPEASQQLEVWITDLNGCTAEDLIRIIVDRTRHVYVPNVFYPDKTNLTVYGGRDVALVESFKIFDRWGEEVFESLDFEANDVNAGWNGTFKGSKLLPGVYAYMAVVRFIDGKQELFSGDVTILH